MIEIKHITTERLKGASFRLPNGARYGILGAPGSGKTDLCAVLSGALLPTSGRVSVDGFDMAKKPIEARKSLSYVPMGAPLYGDLTPFEYLTFLGESRGLSYERTVRLSNDALERSIPERKRDKRIARLSDVERLLLAIASASVGQGDVLILDEPTEGLSVSAKGRVRDALAALEGDGQTVLLATRSASLCEALCDRILILDGGRIAYDLSCAELTLLRAGGTPEACSEEEAEAVRTLLSELALREEDPRVLKKRRSAEDEADEYEEIEEDDA